MFPACAGVSLIDMPASTICGNVPRVCGGEPAQADSLMESISCSPRVRG